MSRALIGVGLFAAAVILVILGLPLPGLVAGVAGWAVLGSALVRGIGTDERTGMRLPPGEGGGPEDHTY